MLRASKIFQVGFHVQFNFDSAALLFNGKQEAINNLMVARARVWLESQAEAH